MLNKIKSNYLVIPASQIIFIIIVTVIVVALVRPLYVSFVYLFAPVLTFVDKRKIKIWVNSKLYII